jgi:glycosyltransferase involved in cell wall biosynthesis
VKGFDQLLRAFVRVRDSSAAPTNAHLRIVGDGSQRSNLEQLASRLGISEYVTFVGRVPPDDIAPEYAQAEVFCALPRSEALGNVFLEAQAGGCAVVAPEVGGISDLRPPDVRNSGLGWELRPEHAEEDAQHAIVMLLTHEDVRRKIAASGIANAVRYDWDTIAAQYADVYDRVLGTGRVEKSS